MSDNPFELIQYVDIGTRNASGNVLWDNQHHYRVPAEHRHHILDREAKNGLHPGADGWLWCAERVITDDLVIVTRVRWEDPKWEAA